MAGKVRRRRGKTRVKERTARFFDYNLVFLAIFLTVIGLIMIFSATAYKSSGDKSSSAMFFSQALFAVIGIVAMVGVSFIPYRCYKYVAILGVAASVVLILLVKSPIGYESHGAARWIQIGKLGTIQVAEPVKIAVIIYSALIISRIGKQVSDRKGTILHFSVSAVLAMLLLLVTNNMSSAIIVMGISFCMYFVAHPNVKGFLIFAAIVAAAVGAVVLIAVLTSGSGGGFRLERVAAWLNPEEFSGDTSFQTLQALYAIGSGGLFGKGLGSSAQKLIMPEVQNDMIFSIICEELGLFGAMVVILLFILLLYRIIYIARNVKESFGAMLVTGVFAHIALQVVINIAVVTNSIPNTGVSLPFISAGGSSLVFLMIEIGMVLNVSKSIPYE